MGRLAELIWRSTSGTSHSQIQSAPGPTRFGLGDSLDSRSVVRLKPRDRCEIWLGRVLINPVSVSAALSMSALPRKRTSSRQSRDVRLVPCVDGSELARTFLTSQAWVGAAMCSACLCGHMTAGHNALRGSGPGQKPAFENAVARVGCPDRRIDRLCITCCSPSQPSHHAKYSARSRYGLSATG